MIELTINTTSKLDSIDITSKIDDLVKTENWEDGILILYCPHTTAAVTVNEHYDPTVVEDIQNALYKMIPNMSFKHLEGNSDAHIKTSLLGNSICLIVENNQVILGTWQRILFFEFDGPRRRKLFVKFISSKR